MAAGRLQRVSAFLEHPSCLGGGGEVEVVSVSTS